MRKELTRTKQALSNESIQRIIDTTAYGPFRLAEMTVISIPYR